ncbi:MAG: site-2 protease family protein [Clostridia bacterium]
MKLSMLNANFFSSVLYIILAVLVLLFMVLIHELGHYTAGRMLGFKIDEFSVGFGKAIFSKKNKRGELISLRIFPLGGYCAFAGENEDGAVGDDSRAFNKQKPWKRMIVLFFGAFFNFLSAIIFSFILLVSFGYDIPQVTAIKENSINQNLQVGDIIYEVNGNKIDFAYSGTLNKLLSDFDDTQPITLKIKRDGKMQDCVVSLMKNPKENEADAQTYQLGIEVKAYRHSFGEAHTHSLP